MIRTVHTTRYVTPLREGGSLPALVEADDDGLYVLKFRGAGQGPKALIAELVAGEIGRALGLPVPEIVFMELDPEFGRAEPDPELSDLLSASAGLNLALDYLPGSLAFQPLVGPELDPALASAVVWFDAFVSNVDRTPKNPNLLLWHRRLWLIDHGAALYVHHAWTDATDPLADAPDRFPLIKNHALLPFARDIAAADAALSARLTPARIAEIVAAIPDAWLVEPEPPVRLVGERRASAFTSLAEGDAPAPSAAPSVPSVDARRAKYAAYLTHRLASPRGFVEEALGARTRR
ncbi:aminotransferase class I and II [Sorangium cellulosum]|uniref:Aminotransferase class I and II n=1 Tax=Sorangium cellulosum TaxID=56 RepID=A0A150SYD0_SORCE|nr:aminotransferase class I and II [Sorangium cellulosum]KYF97688.1 aminotransferase class I and II [Sorangium cellulosum]